MHNFTAIDFETAVGKRYSICQVGLVRVENNKVTEKLNILVQPPNNEYFWKNTEIHGLSANDTENAPTFDKVWHKLQPFIENQIVVAHNATFDCDCLKKTLAYYTLPQPEYESRCTLKIYGENLAALCHKYKIKLNHHDALSDAMACAQLYLLHLNNTNN